MVLVVLEFQYWQVTDQAAVKGEGHVIHGPLWATEHLCSWLLVQMMRFSLKGDIFTTVQARAGKVLNSSIAASSVFVLLERKCLYFLLTKGTETISGQSLFRQEPSLAFW